MKAIVFNPDLVKPVIKEMNIPKPGPNEVLIKLHAAALNHRDLNITRPGINQEFVYGSDGAGTIFELGEGVTEWAIGDEVIINSYISCMKCEDCLAGNHTFCEHGRVLGSITWAGTFSEYVKIPSRNVVKKPEHLTFEQSAALPLSLGTSWRAMVTQARIKAGDTVFIQGIGGGVSLYSMQIAVALGCKVVVSSSSDEKLETALNMGASAGINYVKENVLNRVMELTNGKGFDVIISSHGGSVPLSMDAAKIGGTIVQFAFLGDKLTSFEIDKIMGKQLTLIGTGDQTYEEFKAAIDFFNQKKLVPAISEVFTLEEISEAFTFMHEGKQFGKIGIKIVKD